MAKPTTKQARVLVAVTLDGVALRPNDIVAVSDAQLKSHADALDTSPEAIAAARAAGGREINPDVDIEPAPAE